MCARSRVVIPSLLRRINTTETQANMFKNREKIWVFLLMLSWLFIFALVMKEFDGKGD